MTLRKRFFSDEGRSANPVPMDFRPQGARFFSPQRHGIKRLATNFKIV